jgi:hypothetical protein
MTDFDDIIELHIYAAQSLAVANRPRGNETPTDISLNTLDTEECDILAQFYDTLRTSNAGMTLCNAIEGTSLKDLDINCVQLLEEMSNNQDFALEYMMVKGLTTNEKTQRLVQISLNPVTVFYGSGENDQQADNRAARGALEYLKVLLNSKLEGHFKAWTRTHANKGQFLTCESTCRKRSFHPPKQKTPQSTVTTIVTLTVTDMVDAGEQSEERPIIPPPVDTSEWEGGGEERPSTSTPPGNRERTKGEKKQMIESNSSSSDTGSSSSSDSDDSDSDNSDSDNEECNVHTLGKGSRIASKYDHQHKIDRPKTDRPQSFQLREQEGESARMSLHDFSECNPTTGAHKQPKQGWITHPDVTWTHHPGSRKKKRESEPDLSD